MSSKVAAYFPEALGSRSGVRDLGTVNVGEVRPQQEAVEPVALAGRADGQLLSDIAQGQKDALAIIFRRYASPIRSIGMKVLRNRQEAEDLVQEVFLTVFRSAAQFSPARQKASSWILHIGYQRAFDRRRYLNTRRFCNGFSLDDVNGDSFAALEETGAADRVLSAIFCKEILQRCEEHLTPDQRSVIQLFFFEGYALKEIAPILGQTAGNVRNHFYRGMEQLRRSVLPELSR
jgi:RNA polymerase sigma-70 factor, ECF subfamily